MLVYMYNSFRWHLHRLLSETDAFIVGDDMLGYCNTVTFLQKNSGVAQVDHVGDFCVLMVRQWCSGRPGHEGR